MNNGEILQRLSLIIGALNNVEVKGAQNLKNLAGAIDALDELGRRIAKDAEERAVSPAPEGSGVD